MSRGGKRPGSGRPKGSINSSTAVKQEIARAMLSDKRERSIVKFYLSQEALVAAGLPKREAINLSWDAYKFVKGYKSGKPKETVEMKGDFVDIVRQALQAGEERLEREQAKIVQINEITQDTKKNEFDDLVASGSPN